MSGILLDHDPVTGITRRFHYDPVADNYTIETEQDLSGIVESTKGRSAFFDERTPWKGDMHLVARIPNVLYFKMVKSGMAQDEGAMKRWLNDPDNRIFRTRPGKV